MRSRKSQSSKTTKFVRVDNATWIEADIWVPDEVARIQFLQKVQLTKPGPYLGHIKSDNLEVRG
ncbi:MAG TPA: hypothetical protein PK106_00680 [Bacteroidales bacterium]|nr:hypothetical protein [Bacteroidales bacterium]